MRLFRRTIGSLFSLTFVLAGLCGGTVQGASTAYTWQGGTSGDWSTAANWKGGVVPSTDGTYSDPRINVSVSTGGHALVYSASQGYTNYSNTTTRTLYISAGEMQITGGTLETSGNVANLDGMGDSSKNTVFTITGGEYRITRTNAYNGFTVHYRGAGSSTLNIQGGTFAADSIMFNSSANTSTANATANLTGGVLLTGSVYKAAGGTTTSTFNFNGGTLKARIAGGTFGASGSLGALDHAYVKAGGAIIDTNSFDYTVTQNLEDGTGGTGTNGLTKLGQGTLFLSGTNTYVGGTKVQAGALAVASFSALPDYNTAGKVTVSSGATLAVTGESDFDTLRTSAVTFESGSYIGFGVSAGSSTVCSTNLTNLPAGLAKVGLGTLTLSGVNTYTGGTRVIAGNLTVANLNALPDYNTAGKVSVDTGATLAVTNASDFNALRSSAATFGAGSYLGIDTTDTGHVICSNITSLPTNAIFTKLGAGKLTLAGTNTYTNATQVLSGTLAYGANNAVSSASDVTVNGGELALNSFSGTVGSVTLTSGTISGTGTLTSTSGFSVQNGVVAANLAGNVGLTQVGDSIDPTLRTAATLSGVNTYTGGTHVAVGALTVTSLSALPEYNTPGKVTVDSGAVLAAANVSDFDTLRASAVTFNTGSYIGIDIAAGDNVTYSSNLSSLPAGLAKVGRGTLTLSGTNTYSGGTFVRSGILTVTSLSALSGYDTAGQVTVGSNTVLAVTNLSDFQTLNGTTSSAVTFERSSALGFDTTGGDITLSDPITSIISSSSGVGLAKVGTGTLTLNAANTYTYQTKVWGGTLAYGVDNAINTGSVSINYGAELAMGAHTDSVGAVTVTDGRITGTGTLTSTSGFNVGNGSISVNLAGDVAMTKTIGTATMTLSGTNSYTGGTNINAGCLTVTTLGALPDYGTAGKVVVADGAVLAATNASDFDTLRASAVTFNAGSYLGIDTTAGDVTYSTSLS
ncbi:MAG: autotransporter-associated beta strand repeat-containing protein, partial [Thermoguttaceae bacterium]